MRNLIYIESEDQVITLPVNPEEIYLKRSGNNETVDLVQLGEALIPREAKLATIEIESFFPENPDGLSSQSSFHEPDYYIDFFETLQRSKKPFRFILSGTKINQLMLIESFEYGVIGGSDDIEYKLSLKEYKAIQIKSVKIVQTSGPKEAQVKAQVKAAQPAPTRTAPVSKSVTIGCSVKVNGQLHRDSYGNGPGKTLSGFTGKINFINDKGSHPYHVTNDEGGWLGWVSKGSAEVVG